MATQSQLVIQVSPTGFTQTLAQTFGITNWSFPVVYEVAGGSKPAALAQINIEGAVTNLTLGQPSQTVKGSGRFVDLLVDLGPNCAGVKIGSNPYNKSGCFNEYPFLSIFTPQSDDITFQVACVGQAANWNLGVDLEFQNNPEVPPTSANVSLLVDGQTYKSVPQGQSSFSPSGSILAFVITNFQGTGLKIGYTLQTAAAA